MSVIYPEREICPVNYRGWELLSSRADDLALSVSALNNPGKKSSTSKNKVLVNQRFSASYLLCSRERKQRYAPMMSHHPVSPHCLQAQDEIAFAIERLSVPEKCGALVESIAMTLTDAGITADSEAFTSFLDVIATMLPQRMNALDNERLAGVRRPA